MAHIFITPQQLFAYAKRHNMLNDPIRICDGMAVSYFPTINSVARSQRGIVLDLSCDDPIGYDDLLPQDRTIVYHHNGKELSDPYAPKELDEMK